MNKSHLFTFVCLFVFIFTACNEKENLIPDDCNISLEQTTTYTFTYKGIKYTSDCTFIDGEMVLADDEVRSVFNEIDKNPNSAQFVTENNDIIFYDSFDELSEALRIFEENAPKTRAEKQAWTIQSSKFRMYADKNYQNCFQTHELGMYTGSLHWVPQMPIGYDKKLDSFSMEMKAELITYTPAGHHTPPSTIYFDLYENENYKGKSITFRFTIIDGDVEYYVPDLSKYAFDANSSWSKKASSYLLYIGTGLILLP